MKPGTKSLFAAAVILSAVPPVATPVVSADSDKTAASALVKWAFQGESGDPAKDTAEVSQPPRNVNFDKSLRCLAMNIYHESRSESRAGQIAVASVTLNRVKSKKFPGTVCDVVKQGGHKRRNRCQFSWWCDGRDDKPTNEQAWGRAMEIGRLSLMGITDDPTNGALYYHAEYVQPSWSRAFERSARIGKHLFYKATKPLLTAKRN